MLLAVLAVLVVVLASAACRVDAARPAPEARLGGGLAAHGSVYRPAAFEKAKEAVELLLARLPAGPSPKGPGH